MERLLKLNIRILIVYFLFIVSFGLFSGRVESTKSKTEVDKSAENQPIVITPKVVRKVDKEVTSETKSQPLAQIPVVTETEAPTPQQKESLLDDLGLHNTTSDCWVYIEGHIYDITTYFGNHPGGDTIMARYCGSDATNAFNTKEKGVPHSGSARSILANFLIQ